MQTITNEGLKVLKITKPSGVEQYVPLNPTNKNHHEQKKRYCSREKQAKYLIEEVLLSWQDAAELGFSEAINKLNPPKKTEAQQTNDTLAALLKQNAELIAALTGAKKSKGGQDA
jgi:hypothetical protein